MPTVEMPRTLSDALRSDAAARWVACALQVNPFGYLRDHDKSGGSRWPDADAYNRALVAALGAAGVGIIGITDHNRFDDTAESLRAAARAAGIVVFPGFEYTSSCGVHWLCLFEPEASRQDLESVLYEMRAPPRAGQDVGRFSSPDLPQEVRKHGGIAIAAHIEEDRGLFTTLHSTRRAAWRNAELHAVAVRPETMRGAATARNEKEGKGHLPRLVKDVLENKIPEYRRAGLSGVPAALHAADVSSPDDLAGDKRKPALTWLKLGDMSVHGLRCAFMEHKLRVRREAPQRQDGGALRALAWEGPRCFLHGEALPLSEDLTALIGGRGSGKSAMVESMRFVLNLPIHDDLKKRSEGQLREVLGVGTTVWAALRASDGREYVVRRLVHDRDSSRHPPEVFQMRSEEGAHVLVPLPQIRVRDLLDLRLLGQGEGSSLAENKKHLTGLLGRFRSSQDEHGARQQSLKQIGDALERNRQALTAADREAQEHEETAQQLASLEVQLAAYAAQGLDELLAESTKLAHAQNAVELARKEVVGVDEVCAKLSALELGRALRAAESLDSVMSAEQLARLGEVSSKLQEAVDAARQGLVEATRVAHVAVAKLKAELEAREASVSGRLASAFDGKPDGRAAREKLGRLREDRRAAKMAHEQWLQSSKVLAELRAERERLLDEWAALLDAEEKALRRAAANLAQALADHRGKRTWLKASIERKPDIDAGIGLLKTLRGIGEGVAKKITAPDDFDPRRLARDMGLGEEALRTSWSFTEGTARSLAGAGLEVRLQLEEVSSIFETRLDLDIAWDDPEASAPDYRPIDHLSIGQRATALLLLLLAKPEGQGPLIIDQPEDDLDNRYVYEHLVERVAACKGHRQLIFATHNANLPVLGDAELVVPLETHRPTPSDLRGRIDRQRLGPVDAERTRPAVETILEGSKEAFRRRARRYRLHITEHAPSRDDEAN